jgi:hypothetical protein
MFSIVSGNRIPDVKVFSNGYLFTFNVNIIATHSGIKCLVASNFFYQQMQN